VYPVGNYHGRQAMLEQFHGIFVSVCKNRQSFSRGIHDVNTNDILARRTFYNWWRRRKHKQQTKDESHLHMSWEQDYHLQDPGRLALFDEYLEMSNSYTKLF
jgi:DNA-directed RNA polymerase specialized sigma24 family protein